MKRDIIFLILLLGLGAWVLPACRREAAQVPGTPADSLGGYVAEVEGLGVHFSGMPSTEWKRYERLRYDKEGRERERTVYWDGAETHITTTYDAQGRKVKVKRVSTDRAGNIEYTTTWSDDGQKSVEEEFAHAEGKVVTRITVVRDAGGKLLEELTENLQFIEEAGIDSQRVVYRYDGSGHLVLKEEHFQGKVIPGTRYINDSLGRAVRVEQADSDGNVTEVRLQDFDGQGNVVRLLVQEAGQPEPQLRSTSKWNAAGKLVEQHWFSGDCGAAGQAAGRCPIARSVRYTYDGEGRVLTEDRFEAGATKPTAQLRYKYTPFAQ